jgi:hypothetical protein
MNRSILRQQIYISQHFLGEGEIFPMTVTMWKIRHGIVADCYRDLSHYRRQQQMRDYTPASLVSTSQYSVNKSNFPRHERAMLPVKQPSVMWFIVSGQSLIGCLPNMNFPYQFRLWSSSGSASKKRKKFEVMRKAKIEDPFLVLGISRTPSLTYASVKRSFLQIAMKYHPDMSNATQCSEADREKNKDLFVTARMAFEAIIVGPGGVAILKTEADDYVEEEEDFEEWFKAETGYDIPFMDAATMKEVADMTETVGGGLDRDGGMWTLARMVANTVKSGGDGRSVLQLEAGVIRDQDINGVLRRKRRR